VAASWALSLAGGRRGLTVRPNALASDAITGQRRR
jgi:hypothetical protein